MANNKQIKTRLQQLHDYEVNWIKAGANSGFIPLAGEEILYMAETAETELPEGRSKPITYNRKKIGDGVTNINDLPFEPNLLYIEQELTEAQKVQARENIGAIGMQYNEIPQDGEILIYDATTNNLVNSGYTFASLKEWIQQEIQQTILGGEW